jgi:hypothetical protein
MARPESYSDGERMRELSKDHERAKAEQAGLMKAWEELSAKISGIRGELEGLRGG